MSKLGCRCGYIMRYSTMEEDFLNSLIKKEVADNLLKTIDVLNMKESLDDFFTQHLLNSLTVYICPECGRVLVQIDKESIWYKTYKCFSFNAKTCSCGKINLDVLNETNIPYYLIKYINVDEMTLELDYSNPEELFKFCLKHYKDSVRMVYRCFDCDSLLIEDSPKAKTFSLFEYEYK